MRCLSAKLAGCRGLLPFLAVLLLSSHGETQGTFAFRNPGAPTYIGSIGGPLAGANIYAQALVEPTADNPVPLQPTTFHINGSLYGRGIGVPFADPYTYVQVQMAVWDSLLWSASYSAVPWDQLGFTEIVPVFLTRPLGNPDWAHLTRSTIVPVPEPSVSALVFLAVLGMAIRAPRSRASMPDNLTSKPRDTLLMAAPLLL